MTESSDPKLESIATDSKVTSCKELISPWIFIFMLQYSEYPPEQIDKWLAMVLEKGMDDAGPYA